jgi:REP element-mobilizing transposase RayT
MGNGITKSSHSTHSLNYHLIQCVTGKRKIFDNEKIIDLLKTQIYNISKCFNVVILTLEPDKDYFHMTFKAKPTLEIPRYLNSIKLHTSREIKRNFPRLKKGPLWAPSYFLSTSGQVTIETLKNYVDEQRREK